jgi:predicted DNA binding CopG/RHH family protein
MREYAKDELEILDDIEMGKYTSVPNLSDELLQAKKAAKNTITKTKNINIRVSEADILKLKSKSIEAGIPYQTIINALIHNYASGKLKLTI